MPKIETPEEFAEKWAEPPSGVEQSADDMPGFVQGIAAEAGVTG